LAELVGQTGIVYGVDENNPYSDSPNMSELATLSRVKLLKAKIPPFPIVMSGGMDAVITKTFIFLYDLVPIEEDTAIAKPNVSIYQSIEQAINPGGIFAVVLNVIEQDREKGSYTPYQDALSEHLRNFRKVHHENELMIYQNIG